MNECMQRRFDYDEQVVFLSVCEHCKRFILFREQSDWYHFNTGSECESAPSMTATPRRYMIEESW